MIKKIAYAQLQVHSYNIRPIALMACLRKIMETILNTRLTHWLEQQSFFPPNTFGFRHHTSAIACVSTLIADIYFAFLQKQYLNAAFLDIESAFPSVHIPSLLQIMFNHGIPLLFTKFIENLFSPFTLLFPI